MVLYPFLYRNRLLRDHWRKVIRGFSLLEVVLVLFVLGLLAAALAPSVRDVVERGRRDAEAKTLDELTANITASFERPT
jgi:prepilin-type N-terminal cleavage/methylation domain-containing protein